MSSLSDATDARLNTAHIQHSLLSRVLTHFNYQQKSFNTLYQQMHFTNKQLLMPFILDDHKKDK